MTHFKLLFYTVGQLKQIQRVNEHRTIIIKLTVNIAKGQHNAKLVIKNCQSKIGSLVKTSVMD